MVSLDQGAASRSGEVIEMKYMTIWQISPENIEAVIDRFKTADPQPPDGVTLVGRWHEMASGKGFSLIESDDPVAVARFVNAWADLVDQQLVPVLDDAEVVQAL
jgi:hypothetical protein